MRWCVELTPPPVEFRRSRYAKRRDRDRDRRTDYDKVEGLVGDVGDVGKFLLHVDSRLLLGELETLK